MKQMAFKSRKNISSHILLFKITLQIPVSQMFSVFILDKILFFLLTIQEYFRKYLVQITLVAHITPTYPTDSQNSVILFGNKYILITYFNSYTLVNTKSSVQIRILFK